LPTAHDIEAARSLLGITEPGDRLNMIPPLDRPVVQNWFVSRGSSSPSTPQHFDRGIVGNLLLGPDTDRERSMSLDPYRTVRGAKIDTSFVKMEPANGRTAPIMGYQTEAPKEAIDALQAAYSNGASEAELFAIGDQYRVGLTLSSVRTLINERDQNHRPGKFVPAEDRTPPPEPMRPGESMTDYIDRVQGGHFEWTGPYTPSHPTGRNTDEQLRQIFAPWVGHEDAERLSTAAQIGIPVLGAMRAADDGWAALRSGRPGTAAVNSTVALASLFPVVRGAKGSLQVIDALALRKAAEGREGAFDAIQAVQGAVEDGLARGGGVSLRSGHTTHRIVGTNEAGALIDETGKAWGLPAAGERLEIRFSQSPSRRSPKSATTPSPLDGVDQPRPTMRPAGRSGLLSGPKAAANQRLVSHDPGKTLPPLGVDQRPPAQGLGNPSASYDPHLWDESFSNLRYELPAIIRHRFGEEMISSLAFEPAAKLAFQRLAWQNLPPGALNRSLTGPELVSLAQTFGQNSLNALNLPPSRELAAAADNLRDVLEMVARQHPAHLPRVREFERLTIPDTQLRVPSVGPPPAPRPTGLPGEFSIIDWREYPYEHAWPPEGPFRLLEGEEYTNSLKSKNNMNRRIGHALGFSRKPYQIHEVHTIKLAGDPLGLDNRVLLPNDVHRNEMNAFWRKVQLFMERYRP
jgi:hypothetical protein